MKENTCGHVEGHFDLLYLRSAGANDKIKDPLHTFIRAYIKNVFMSNPIRLLALFMLLQLTVTPSFLGGAHDHDHWIGL